MLTKDERTPLYGEEHVEADMSEFMESTFASRYMVGRLTRRALLLGACRLFSISPTRPWPIDRV